MIVKAQRDFVEKLCVPITSLKQQHLNGWVFREAVGEYATGRTRANNDVIKYALVGIGTILHETSFLLPPVVRVWERLLLT